MYFFDPKTLGFYCDSVHVIPAHAIPISDAQYVAAQKLSAGYVLAANAEGFPVQLPAPVSLRPASDLRAQLVQAVNAEYQTRMAAIADGYPLHERESWPVQLEETKSLQANPEAATPWLDACAAARGLDKAELARRVLEKDAAYRVISGNLSGIRQRHEDAIALLETVEQAQDYDVQAWWPIGEGEPQP